MCLNRFLARVDSRESKESFRFTFPCFGRLNRRVSFIFLVLFWYKLIWLWLQLYLKSYIGWIQMYWDSLNTWCICEMWQKTVCRAKVVWLMHWVKTILMTCLAFSFHIIMSLGLVSHIIRTLNHFSSILIHSIKSNINNIIYFNLKMNDQNIIICMNTINQIKLNIWCGKKYF